MVRRSVWVCVSVRVCVCECVCVPLSWELELEELTLLLLFRGVSMDRSVLRRSGLLRQQHHQTHDSVNPTGSLDRRRCSMSYITPDHSTIPDKSRSSFQGYGSSTSTCLVFLCVCVCVRVCVCV